MIDFIGVGAQKSGTSWVYACLYEHPEICAPIKEIHFFSRDRFSNGQAWYEGHFKRCVPNKKCGEFSTSYLYSVDAPVRIHSMYPDVKIIAILRDPIARAISQYGNAIKAGEISESVSFESYYKTVPSVLEQGLYAVQLKRYLHYFNASQMCIMIHEDSKKDPQKFIQTIYAFLGVNAQFVPSMLSNVINVSRVPKHIFIERIMHHSAEALRRCGFDRLVHMVRKSGVPERIRTLNTKQQKKRILEVDRDFLVTYFKEDAKVVSELIGRDVASEWGLTP